MIRIALAVLLASPPKIEHNKMLLRAGTLKANELVVHLEAREGLWYPDGTDSKPRDVAAFAEMGKPLQNPGPLIRVTTGTTVHVFVHNNLDKDLTMYGLGKQRGLQSDSFAIKPGAMQEMTFTADKAGSYYYAGKTTPGIPVLLRGLFDSQLNGAIIVDDPGAPTDDRIFMISWWFDASKTARSGLIDGSLISINGLAWPHTEIIETKQGTPQRYRWINMTLAPHPMHLHGFYFKTDDDDAMHVTRALYPGMTYTMSFTPTRPGNWLLHCHFAGHITAIDAMNHDRTVLESPGMHTMHGLVMGLHVQPTSYAKASYDNARPIRLVVHSKAKQYGDFIGYSFSNSDSTWSVPGPLLLLKKDEPVAVTIVNKSHDMAAVHWHGIELESFPDGVPGFSGYGSNVLHSIAQGDSFTVRFTPPRAGTFMYHSHSNEQQQISSGMYGPIVVTDDAHPYNPETDKLLVFGDAGPAANELNGPFPLPILNGARTSAPMELKVGTTYRFRVINIRSDAELQLQLLDGDQPVMWKQVAEDGADYPASLIKDVKADLHSIAGQTFDFLFTPSKAGELKLRYRGDDKEAPADVLVVVK